MDDTVFTLIQRSISEYKTEIEQFLAGGKASSMEDYSRIVGRYEALRLIEDDLSELEQRFIAE